MARPATTSTLTDLLARHDIWRGRQAERAVPEKRRHPSGWAAFDELLGGGWPREGLVEIYSGQAPRASAWRALDRLGDEPLARYRDWCLASLGFGLMDLLLPLLARLTQEDGVVLLNPPARPCAERWQRGGVRLENLLVVEPRTTRELGWATEEILRSGVYPLTLAWLPPLGFALRRRLKLAAEDGGGCLFSPYPVAAGVASSPARLQVDVRRNGGGRLIVRSRKPFRPREVRIDPTRANGIAQRPVTACR